jgi:hypothetical protein
VRRPQTRRSSKRRRRLSCRMRDTHLVLRLVVGTVTIAIPDEPLSAQRNRYVLTSVEQNIDLGDWQIGPRETGIAPSVPWSVRRQRLYGGK